MFKKTLVAMAVAGALGCSAGAFANSGNHSTYGGAASPTLRMDTSISSPEFASPPIEIGDGVLASFVDEHFDGQLSADDATAVGASAAAGGAGTVAFTSDSGVSTSSSERSNHSSALVDDVYLFPAPLAYNDGTRYWHVVVGPSNLKELDRLHTENVYVMTPIEDAIVDPIIALTSGPDAVIAALTGTEGSVS